MLKTISIISFNVFIIVAYSQPTCLHNHGSVYFYLDAAFSPLSNICNCQKDAIFIPSMPACPTGAYELVFEDNFDGPALDLSKWELRTSNQGGLQGGPEEYNTLDNVTVANGTCFINANKETVIRRAVAWKPDNEILSDSLQNLRTYYYTSSNIWTKEKFFYGKYEARCKMPDGDGLWPAFWLYGGQRWNEIDIQDGYKGVKRLVTSIGHDYDGNGEAEGCNDTHPPMLVPSNYDFSEWHTFTCIFDFDKISFQVDGETVRVIHRFETISGIPIECGENIAQGTYYKQKSFPIESMSIILNLAIGDVAGPVPATTFFPKHFDIDYVRMWKKGPGEEIYTCTPFRPNDVVINDNHIHNTNTLHIRNSITNDPSVTIEGDANIWWTAGNYIEFTDGFTVEEGAQLTAEIKQCSDFVRMMNDPNNVEQQPVQNVSDSSISKSSIISPNPTSGVFTLSIDENISLKGQKPAKTVFIYNPLGQLVYQQLYNPTQQIDLSSQPKGIYFVKVQSAAPNGAGKVYTEKVVVQ